jgi:hypothetical protein
MRYTTKINEATRLSKRSGTKAAGKEAAHTIAQFGKAPVSPMQKGLIIGAAIGKRINTDVGAWDSRDRDIAHHNPLRAANRLKRGGSSHLDDKLKEREDAIKSRRRLVPGIHPFTGKKHITYNTLSDSDIEDTPLKSYCEYLCERYFGTDSDADMNERQTLDCSSSGVRRGADTDNCGLPTAKRNLVLQAQRCGSKSNGKVRSMIQQNLRRARDSGCGYPDADDYSSRGCNDPYRRKH